MAPGAQQDGWLAVATASSSREVEELPEVAATTRFPRLSCRGAAVAAAASALAACVGLQWEASRPGLLPTDPFNVDATVSLALAPVCYQPLVNLPGHGSSDQGNDLVFVGGREFSTLTECSLACTEFAEQGCVSFTFGSDWGKCFLKDKRLQETGENVVDLPGGCQSFRGVPCLFAEASSIFLQPPPLEVVENKMTFYMYRPQGPETVTWEDVNAFDLAGAMWYLHRMVLNSLPRKFGISRLVRFKVTVTIPGGVFDEYLPYDRATGVMPPKKVVPRYQRLEYGMNGCPPGLEIRTPEECKKAIRELGLQLKPTYSGAYDQIPLNCAHRIDSKPGEPHMHFNNGTEGQARDDLAPICLGGGDFRVGCKRLGVEHRLHANYVRDINVVIPPPQATPPLLLDTTSPSGGMQAESEEGDLPTAARRLAATEPVVQSVQDEGNKAANADDKLAQSLVELRQELEGREKDKKEKDERASDRFGVRGDGLHGGLWFSLPKQGHCIGSQGSSPTCTYWWEPAGELDLSELSGILDPKEGINTYEDFWKNSFSKCQEDVKMGKRKGPCVQPTEYNSTTNRGKRCGFWDIAEDPERCVKRMKKVRDLLVTKFPDMPYDLGVPSDEMCPMVADLPPN